MMAGAVEVRTEGGLARLRRLRAGVRARARILQPLWLPALVVVGLSGALVHPQSQDVLAEICEHEGWAYWSLNLRLSACLALFCVCAWIFPRSLLRACFRAIPREPDACYVRWRLATPWALGLLPLGAAMISAWMRGASALAWQFAGLWVLGLGGVVWTLFRMHARLRDDVQYRREVVPERTRLSPLTRKLFVAAIAVSALLWGVFLWSPVVAPQLLGALGVLCLAGAGWLATGSLLLVYPTYRYDLPSFSLAALVYAVLCSPFNDNHALRTVEPIAPAASRPAVVAHFESWRDELLEEWDGGGTGGRDGGKAGNEAKDVAEGDARSPSQKCPIFVVAAEGGGIRAAYWTAAVLAFLEDEFEGFHRHVFAISGVSGGSLGGAAFVAAVAERGAAWAVSESAAPSGESRPAPGAVSRRVRAMLGRDFLAPVIGGAVAGDFVQSFLPLSCLPDRAAFLEKSWERAWIDSAPAALPEARSEAAPNPRFSQDLLGLYVNADTRLPSLFLNGTFVTGGRHITSNLRFDTTNFGGAQDLLGLLSSSLRLSTAVHNSARFTYISPAGMVPVDLQTAVQDVGDPAGDSAGGQAGSRTGREGRRIAARPLARQIVDGGYFENSGALTAQQIIELIEPRSGATEIYALVLLNSPEHLPQEPQEVSGWLAQSLAPIRAMLGTRSARGLLAMADLEKALSASTARDGHPHVLTFQLPLLGERPAPLGWMLATSTRDAIDNAVLDLRRGLQESVKAILDGGAGDLHLEAGAVEKNRQARWGLEQLIRRNH